MQFSFFMQESKGCTSAQGGICAAIILRALQKKLYMHHSHR